MDGLIKEGGEAAREDYEGDVKGAAFIGAAQRVEHYEIAAYGTVRAMAEKLGDDKAAKLLIRPFKKRKKQTKNSPSWSSQWKSKPW
jgi:ferritin-like metal-binding protein YciE